MRIMHIVFESTTSLESGAPLRNYAIGRSLSHIARFDTIVVQDYFTLGQSFPDRKPSYVEADIPLNIVEDIVARVHTQHYDIVIVEGVFLADICTRLIETGEHVIVDMHNIESALLRENDSAKYGRFASLIKAKRWKRAKAAEKTVAEKVTEIWVCSRIDADRLKMRIDPAAIIQIVPNPIPAWCETAIIPSRTTDWKVKLLFVGHLSYRPNIRAACRLMQSIFPKLRQTCPDAELVICGRNPGNKLQRLAGRTAGVRLVGDPDDLRPYYTDATIAAVPLAEGGGTRLKILEAISMGLPVVATPKAVEGLCLVANEMYLQATEDNEFVASILDLAENEMLRKKLVTTSQNFISENHSSRAVDQVLTGLIVNAGLKLHQTPEQ